MTANIEVKLGDQIKSSVVREEPKTEDIVGNNLEAEHAEIKLIEWVKIKPQSWRKTESHKATTGVRKQCRPVEKLRRRCNFLWTYVENGTLTVISGFNCSNSFFSTGKSWDKNSFVSNGVGVLLTTKNVCLLVSPNFTWN